MAVIHDHIDAPPEAVFDVLLDAHRYADWVVGAKSIRAVDREWPAAGSRFHHRVGIGPLTIEDSTVLESSDPPRTITLRARARPAGVARVHLRLTATDDGGTDVEMDEYPVSGPGRWIHNPLLDGVIAARNRKSLRRLGRLVRSGA